MSAPIGGTPVKVRGLISLAWLQRGDTTTIVWDATAVELVNAGYLEILEVLPVDPGSRPRRSHSCRLPSSRPSRPATRR
ncbi:hypothetical protein LZP97_26940 (plasmid) [Rhodococcus sp. DMF-1]|uniref:hypothetical protein n=1 Tax=Rhodococcus sp. DMF-1 TaxID=2907624 RepID=UPI001F46AF01|nr:hypothetical protein [Rhodococcus sp. DMF-1]UIR36974.1 hypothetical protein LZP97_25910 [Rhodococcus sp. DMF-1]UIR39823.1 hypothetical protein LZP97_26940 [Rhodococcus sp. DMF-1]